MSHRRLYDGSDAGSHAKPTTREKCWRIFLVGNVILLLGCALALRVWKLGTIPGLNGDEAEYGVKALSILDGNPPTESPSFWFTATGNPVNPFFVGLETLLHAAFSPSVALLRSAAVLSGLLALVLNYRLCRTACGPGAAWVSTVLLATLPVSIAYSRLAWDACQTLLFAVPVVYWSLAGFAVRREPFGGRGQESGVTTHHSPLTTHHASCKRLIGAHVAYLGAVLVHPTNIFLLPLVLAASGMWLWRQSPASSEHNRSSDPDRQTGHQQQTPGFSCRGLWLIAVVSLAATAAIVAHQSGQSQLKPQRILDAGAWMTFGLRFIDLFSGETVYRYVAGSVDGLRVGGRIGIVQAFGILVASAAAALVLFHLRRSDSHRERMLCGSLAVAILGLFVAAGPSALRPGYERYALWLVVPTVVLVSIPIGRMIERPFAPAALLVLGVAWANLAGFWVRYVSAIEDTGGLSHMTFRTSAEEPKQRALNLIVEKSDPTAATWVVTDQWWNYWSLEYFAHGDPNVRVMRFRDFRDQPQAWEMLAAGRVWFVVFDGDPLHARMRRFLDEAKVPWREERLLDSGGKACHWIMHTVAVDKRPASQRQSNAD